MGMTRFSDVKRDDGSTVTVEWEVLEHGEPNDHLTGGGSSPVIGVVSAHNSDGLDIELTDKERERIEEELATSYDPDDEPDFIDE